jgi:hypothetical protein
MIPVSKLPPGGVDEELEAYRLSVSERRIRRGFGMIETTATISSRTMPALPCRTGKARSRRPIEYRRSGDK